MQIPPASVLESWPTANYGAPGRGQANRIINFIFFPLSIIFLFLRIYTRLRITKSFGLDDVFILVAAVPTTAFFALALAVDLHYNLFRHTWDIPFPAISTQLKINIAAECIYALAFMFTKLSILELVRRILKRSTSRAASITIVASMVLIFLEGSVFIMTVIFQCSPISAYWTLSIGPQNCIDEQTNLLVADILNTITDFLVVILPIFFIWTLKLPTRQHVLVTSLFGLGMVAVIAGVFRTVLFYHEGIVYDKTWAAYYVWIPSAIELYTGILCASIPPTQPLFIKLFPTAFAHIQLSSKRSSPPTLLSPTYRSNSLHPPRQLSLSQSALSIEKQIRKGSNIRPPSRITVEDEVLISYEKLTKTTSHQASREKFLDLERGSSEKHFYEGHSDASPKKIRGRSKSRNRNESDMAPNHVRPGIEWRSGLDNRQVELRHSTSQRIRFLKAPQAKLVRIDLENQRIRTITPDSAWDDVGGGSKHGSPSSTSASPKIARSASYETVVGKEDWRTNSKRSLSKDARERKIDRSGSVGSALTDSSRVIGIGVAIDETIPLPPPIPHSYSFNQHPPLRSTSFDNSRSSTSKHSSSQRASTFSGEFRDFSSEATESLNRFNTPRFLPASQQESPGLPSPHSLDSSSGKGSGTGSGSGGGIRNTSRNTHRDYVGRPGTGTSNPSTTKSTISPKRNGMASPKILPPTPTYKPMHEVHISGLLDNNVRARDGSIDRSRGADCVDSIRTSEIPSLSAIQRVMTRQQQSEGRLSVLSGSTNSRESFVLGANKGYPQPLAFRKKEPQSPRVDSPTLSFATEQMVRSIRKGFA